MSQVALKREEFHPMPGDRFKDLPMEFYHGGDGVSKSGLSLVGQSPLHYWNAYLNPDREARTETPAQMLGSAIHCMVLEPELFDSQYVVPPKINKRSSAGKEEWAQWETNNQGKILLDVDQIETVKRAADSVLKHRLAKAYLSNGTAEESFFWEDEETGTLCKCRPDFNRDDILVDLKTTADASKKAFMRTITNFNYHVSDVFSSAGYEAVTGRTPKAYKFIVVETKAPYGVAIYDLDDAARERGRELMRRELDLFAECIKTNTWPGYSEASETLSLPAYAFFD
tara:strand:+ start:34144 stop:34995 length:852 start_codon:yes stop_codon:yes gene_type:complete